MSIKEKIQVVQQVTVNFSQTQKRDFAYRATVGTRDELKDYFKGELGEENEAVIRECLKVADKTKTLVNPVVGLAIRTNPKNLEKYREKGKRKEALMAEILQIISEESTARAEAAAAARKKNQQQNLTND